MKCPFCHHPELKVTDSREAVEQNAIRRRRECQKCLQRFTTFETIELTLQVHKRDGRYEDFQKQKLINGLEAACRHTSISREQVETLASEVLTHLLQRHIKEISTEEIGKIVIEHLQKLDPIAYIRFACVYRRLKKVDELMEAILAITPKDKTLPLRAGSVDNREGLLPPPYSDLKRPGPYLRPGFPEGKRKEKNNHGITKSRDRKI